VEGHLRFAEHVPGRGDGRETAGENLFSDTYWAYGSRKEVKDAPYFQLLSRPYPEAVAGRLIRYRSDLESRSFKCVWEENPSITAPSLIYLPHHWFPNGYLVIPSIGRRARRSLKVESVLK